MANINELKWKTPKGEKYPVAKTSIANEDVQIIKYDDDSFALVNTKTSDKRELNKSQLEDTLKSELVNPLTFVDNSVLDETEIIYEKLKRLSDVRNWSYIDSKYTLKTIHAELPGGVLYIIKESEDVFKIAVINIPPNVNGEIRFQETDYKGVVFNCGFSLGYDMNMIETFYERILTETENVDHQIVVNDKAIG